MHSCGPGIQATISLYINVARRSIQHFCKSYQSPSITRTPSDVFPPKNHFDNLCYDLLREVIAQAAMETRFRGNVYRLGTRWINFVRIRELGSLRTVRSAMLCNNLRTGSAYVEQHVSETRNDKIAFFHFHWYFIIVLWNLRIDLTLPPYTGTLQCKF